MNPRPVFSFIGSRDDHPQQRCCWITHTSEKTHEIIRSALHRSPMFSGVIEGTGTPLLSEYRRQGGSIRRARPTPDFYRT